MEKRTERRRRFPFFATTRPLVFAHRGGSALAPENTIDAFAQGVALGADGLELDVHLSRDGVVVVHHDFTLDRTTISRVPCHIEQPTSWPAPMPVAASKVRERPGEPRSKAAASAFRRLPMSCAVTPRSASSSK